LTSQSRITEGPRPSDLDVLPYRGPFGARRPHALDGIRLPPASMPSRHGLRPLKAWRYVGVFGPDVMVCAAAARIGPVRQSFWAVWDRTNSRLYERTVIGSRAVRLETGRVQIRGSRVHLDLIVEEAAGVESVCPSDGSYAWTRKQGGVPAHGTIELDGVRRDINSHAIVDDTAAYYPRHTSWRWSAGVGLARDGDSVAWNLVSGVNDPPSASERTVWIAARPVEVGPCTFDSEGLSGVDSLRFAAEAVRERRDNLLLLRSSYRQPFGTFSGELPGGVALAEGYGVMEAHDVWW
jgi:uncharacterized protein DUF2804